MNQKKQKSGFLGILFGALAASLMGRALTGRGVKRAAEGTIRVKIAKTVSSLKQF